MASVIDESCAIPDASDDMSPEGERPGLGATVGMFLDWVEKCPSGVRIAAEAVGQSARARDARNIELTSA